MKRIPRSIRVALVVAAGALSTVTNAAETLCATVAEITAAAKTARPGDVVVLKDGMWTDTEIAFTAEGTAAEPVVLRAATAGKVVFTGRSRVRISGRYVVVDGLRFEHCTSGESNFD